MISQAQSMKINAVLKELGIEETKTKVEEFDDWMRNCVKSIHYSDNEAMYNAYERIL